ncbi:MAG: hypothetical protein M3R59_09420 [Verrucomicrobiota bacterium]|nr:hypothetical protein [Verrucomicrobiota bacterium]
MTLQRLRVLAAALLLVSIFLPLSECSRHEHSAARQPVSLAQRLFPQGNADFDYQYGYKVVGVSLMGILTIVAFSWPILFLVCFARWPRRRRFLWLAELLLCAGTLYWIHALSLGGKYLYGAYVAAISVVAFGFGTVMLWRRAVRQRDLRD